LSDRPPKQSPSLPLQASGKSWYRSFIQVGFNYGPTFRNMIKIQMDHRSRVVSCETRIRREGDLQRNDSSFTIHPGTVDCCLQSIIVAIYSGKLSKITHAFVPIGIDSMTAWTGTVGQNEESGRINTWVYGGSDRHYFANSQLMSDEGKLLLELQGVHCVAYEAAVPQLIQENQQKLPYWQMRWMPDLRLNKISRALKVYTKPSVSDIVVLLCHNNSSTRVLDIGGRFAPELMKNNASIDLTVSASSDEVLRSKKDALKKSTYVKFVKLDFTRDVLEASPGADYDLIIASEVLASSLTTAISLLDDRRLA